MSVVVFLTFFLSNIRGFFLFNFLFLCEIAEAIPFSFQNPLPIHIKKNMIISDVQNKVLTLRRDKIFSGDYSVVGPIIAVFTHSNKIACCNFALSMDSFQFARTDGRREPLTSPV